MEKSSPVIQSPSSFWWTRTNGLKLWLEKYLKLNKNIFAILQVSFIYIWNLGRLISHLYGLFYGLTRTCIFSKRFVKLSDFSKSRIKRLWHLTAKAYTSQKPLTHFLKTWDGNMYIEMMKLALILGSDRTLTKIWHTLAKSDIGLTQQLTRWHTVTQVKRRAIV